MTDSILRKQLRSARTYSVLVALQAQPKNAVVLSQFCHGHAGTRSIASSSRPTLCRLFATPTAYMVPPGAQGGLGRDPTLDMRWGRDHDHSLHNRTPSPMSSDVIFASHVDVKRRSALEALVFFNACQTRV